MTQHHKTLLPDGWARPKGYANGISTTITPNTTMVFVGGMVGWDEKEVFHSDNFVDQFRQTILNTKAILAEGGANPEHMVRMTWFITDRDEYMDNISKVGETYREIMGKNFPAMAVIIVNGLIEKRAKIEIETTAVV